MAYVPKTATERAKAEIKYQIDARRLTVAKVTAEIDALTKARDIIEDMEAEYARDIEREGKKVDTEVTA
jgi:hypothetical protein